ATRRPQLVARHHVIGEQAPVGADYAVEAVPLAQQARDDAFVEAEPDLLPRGSDGPPVVGHDLRRPGCEGGLERRQMVLEVASRIDLVLAVVEVRVLAARLRAAAREVLR